VYVSRIPCTASTDYLWAKYVLSANLLGVVSSRGGGHPCLIAAGQCPLAGRDSQAGEQHDRARAAGAGASGGQLTCGGRAVPSSVCVREIWLTRADPQAVTRSIGLTAPSTRQTMSHGRTAARRCAPSRASPIANDALSHRTVPPSAPHCGGYAWRADVPIVLVWIGRMKGGNSIGGLDLAYMCAIRDSAPSGSASYREKDHLCEDRQKCGEGRYAGHEWVTSR